MLLDEICRPTRRAEDCAEESDHGSAEGGEDSGEGGGFGGDRDTGEALQVGEDVHWEPAIAVTIARMIAMTMAHSQTAIPCLTPLNRAIRPAT